MPRDPKAGEVWDVDFSPNAGREQGGIRPALIVSGDGYNGLPHGLRIVVPITGTNRGLRFQVEVLPPEGGLTKPSLLMYEQVRAQSLARLQQKRGAVDAATLGRVRAIVGIFLGLRYASSLPETT